MRTIESVDDIDDNSRHDTMAVLSTAYNMGVEHLIEDCHEARQMLMALWEGFCDACRNEDRAWEAVMDELHVWINKPDQTLEMLNKERMKNWRPPNGKAQTC